MKFQIFSIVCASLSLSNAYAYSIDSHEILTKVAVQNFNACISSEVELSAFKTITPEQEKIITKGNVFEDSKSVFKRIFHWHFWKPEVMNKSGDVKGNGGIGIKKDFRKRFHKIRRELKQADKSDSQYLEVAYKKLGNLIHYIQDVSIPAHVVPIFHPTLPKMKKDKFDSYKINENIKIDCRDLVAALPNIKNTGFNRILDYSAVRTLKNIKRLIPVSGNTKTTWEAYWKSPKIKKSGKKKNFGKYGEFKNKFGQEKIFECAAGSCTILKYHFDNFAFRQHQMTIDATVRSIMLIQLRNK
jgi:hypothetical protein